tara:strand:- start:4961 stop:5650 length:690 start_codon:yes stop_codon:yes gene_type:complete
VALQNHIGTGLKGAALCLLLSLAACMDDNTPPQHADRSTATRQSVPLQPVSTTEQGAPLTSFGLRGSLGPAAPDLPPSPLPPEPEVPFLGPDDEIATASIAAALNSRPAFDIKVGFAPGDGTTALSTALSDALDQTALAGMTGRYMVAGEVALSSLDTGETGISITWNIRDARGRLLGTITQTSTAPASRIASYWGETAKSAARSAAEGINALIAPEALTTTRHHGNAS